MTNNRKTTLTRQLVFVICMLIGGFLLFNGLFQGKQSSVMAVNGIIDLGDVQELNAVALDGMWKMSWFEDTTFFKPAQSGNMMLPGMWNLKNQPNPILQNDGKAILELEIQVSKVHNQLQLIIPQSFSAYQLFIDGKEYNGMGKIENQKIKKSQLESQLVTFTPKGKTIHLKLIAYNNKLLYPGTSRSILLGLPETMTNFYHKKIIVEGTTVVLPAVIGLVILILYLHMPFLNYLFYFSCIGFCTSLRSLAFSDVLLGTLVTNVNGDLLVKCIIIIGSLSYLLFLKLVDNMIKEKTRRSIILWTERLFIAYIIAAFMARDQMLILIGSLINISMIIMLLFLSIHVYRLKKKRSNIVQGVYELVMLALVSIFMDVVGVRFFSNYINCTTIAATIILIMQSDLLAHTIAESFYKNERLLCENQQLNAELMTFNEELELKVNERTKEILQISKIDSLTGVYNRSAIDKDYRMSLNEIQDNLTVIAICDLDDFKRINDTYGHNFGDEVLLASSSVLTRIFQSSGDVFRWGGEEFLVIVRDLPFAHTQNYFEAARRAIFELDLEKNGDKVEISITIGLHLYNSCLSFDENVSLADDALYRGKDNGKNQVVVSQVTNWIG